jgi:hypothetical protein
MMGRMMRGAGMVDMAPPMGPHAGIAGLRHIEGQIAFYKAELHITDAQTAQWNAFADALRASAKPLETAYAAMMPGGGLPPVAEQLAKRRQLLAAELDSLQSIEPPRALSMTRSRPSRRNSPMRCWPIICGGCEPWRT